MILIHDSERCVNKKVLAPLFRGCLCAKTVFADVRYLLNGDLPMMTIHVARSFVAVYNCCKL